jgi:hypothetical protein
MLQCSLSEKSWTVLTDYPLFSTALQKYERWTGKHVQGEDGPSIFIVHTRSFPHLYENRFFHLFSLFSYPDDGNSWFLWNLSVCLPICAASHPGNLRTDLNIANLQILLGSKENNAHIKCMCLLCVCVCVRAWMLVRFCARGVLKHNRVRERQRVSDSVGYN